MGDISNSLQPLCYCAERELVLGKKAYVCQVCKIYIQASKKISEVYEESRSEAEKKIKESEQIEPEINKEQVKGHIEVEKTGKPVILRAEAYKTIILYASRYANQAIPSSDWKEIYGILIGYSDDQFVYIEHAEAL
ncbi:unnamed protein product, partial [marine sediment metagenome]